MTIVKLSTILTLFISNIFFTLAYDLENPKNNIKYYSSIINSGLVKFVHYCDQLLQSDNATGRLAIRKLSDIHSEIDASRSGIQDDELNIAVKTNTIGLSPSYSKGLVHIPKESKAVPLHHRMKLKYENFELGNDIQFHFPRIKYLKKTLPSITIEPYQRVMSFAIEVCMIPSIWYLELIHCMYMGMAQYYTGIVMSYSLQDLVGSAIMSIGYKDESFSIENCYYSVSLVADDQISKNYIEICKRMEKCLKSGPLSEGPFSEFRTEFEERIKKVYSLLKWKSGDLSPIQFSKYSLLYSLYFVKSRMNLKSFHPEKNFLPIRMMISSLGIYCISGLKNDPPKKFKIVETVAKLVSEGIMSSLDSFDINCPFEVLPLLKFDLSMIVAESFCREIFSIGFIDEDIISNKADNFITITKPFRILIPSYSSVIPKMQHNLRFDKYSTDWMDFVSTEEIVFNRGIEGNKRRKVFTSKTLKNTKKMNPNGIRNRFEAYRTGEKKTKLSKRAKYIFTKGKKRSDIISRHVSGQ
ncbi:uncharacterized protein cubi_03583 [Cryptosporidium ubiquitum]|uniref:Uncharacterized protein n=1 Tax=Cryptosporidium ubiquitum TaxID=857276 RepID=A0A1J4MHR5_9CRYT|nr:uncharacterized protein cubi_03583 [Cryptosporidium ubiquitum]OII73785.1 hypothetical protein cubi_03583 [Cryptosporidium ubiquitum]